MGDDASAGAVSGIDVLTVASFPADLAQDLAAALSRRTTVPCRLLAPEDEIEAALPWLEARNQVDADRLLARLEARPREPGRLLLGLTLLDLGSPLFTFFFGRARHLGPAALVSLARLAPAFYGLPEDPDLLRRRALLEILHEIGHLLGLSHCTRYACVMHFAANVGALDNRGASFCPDCQGALPSVLR